MQTALWWCNRAVPVPRACNSTWWVHTEWWQPVYHRLSSRLRITDSCSHHPGKLPVLIVRMGLLHDPCPTQILRLSLFPVFQVYTSSIHAHVQLSDQSQPAELSAESRCPSYRHTATHWHHLPLDELHASRHQARLPRPCAAATAGTAASSVYCVPAHLRHEANLLSQLRSGPQHERLPGAARHVIQYR